MGHLVKIHRKGVNDLLKTGMYSIKAKLGDKWEKTTADILADALCIRPGDYLFPWITFDRITGDQNEGFKYVFKVSSGPYYSKEDTEFPIKIILEKTGWEYNKALSEDSALDLFGNKLLWNMIGFKSAGRGKANTHQTIEEDNLLISMMDKLNNNSKTDINFKNDEEKDLFKITTSNMDEFSNDENKRIISFPEKERLSKINYENLPFLKGNRFKQEKCLEAWLMEFLDNTNKDILFGDQAKINWFGNYLFYGVQGSNIDIVADVNNNTERQIFAIELKRDKLNESNLKETVDQVDRYSDYLLRAYNTYGLKTVAKKIIICNGLTTGCLNDKNLKSFLHKNNIKIVFYEIINKTPRLKKFAN